MKLFRATIIIPALGIIGGALFWGAGRFSAQGKSTDYCPERTVTVQAVGYVEPRSHIRRLFFPTTGVIGQCYVEIGQSVRKGEVMGALKNGSEEAELRLAVENLSMAEAEAAKILSGVAAEEIAAARADSIVAARQHEYARNQFDRLSRLYASNVVSQADFDLAESALRQSDASWSAAKARSAHAENSVRPEDKVLAARRVELARAKVEVVRQKLDDTLLRAPEDGTILDILKRQGEGASINDPEPIFIFADTSSLRVRAEVDERSATAIKPGQRVRMFGHALGTNSFQGQVELVKKIMGKKSLFTYKPTERKDLDSLDVFIAVDGNPFIPLGLRVDVAIALETNATATPSQNILP